VPGQISIAVGDRQTSGVIYPADSARRLRNTLVLAHGAGAGQASRFIVDFATALAGRGVDVLTFNFLYTEERRKVPDRTLLLEACYGAVVDTARTLPPFAGNKLFIGGKSMGGRMATHLAAASPEHRRGAGPEHSRGARDATAAALSGVVVLGYPLHPPGKPEKLRIEHLPRITVPVLIVQGERDPFGSPEELRPHFAVLGDRATIHAVAGGDHSLAVRGAKQKEDLPGVVTSWIQHYL
jgi:predicted alpha/beta-hydrolase family hydrolase